MAPSSLGQWAAFIMTGLAFLVWSKEAVGWLVERRRRRYLEGEQ